MLDLEQYKFHGVNDLYLSSLFVGILDKLGIKRNGYGVNGPSITYSITRNGLASYEGLPVNISLKDLVSLIFREYPDIEDACWWYKLKVGDKVTIDLNDITGFPGLVSPLYDTLNGKELEIKEVIPKMLPYNINSVTTPGFNGDYSVYILKEYENIPFYSSMFLAPNVNPVKKLEMSSVHISLLDDFVGTEDSLKNSKFRLKADTLPDFDPDFDLIF